MQKRRLLVPEVVQTSAMDCGPAALKCLLEGHGIPVSYGRLREACQTDVDGTSIDTIEDIAQRLGFESEQVMLPVDHLLLAEADALPAVVVVRQPNGATHFVVAWRRHGGWVQVMDPAFGRRWRTTEQFLAEVYVHQASVPAPGWREWAGSAESLACLRRRLRDLGTADRLIATALADPGWHRIAALDASVRMVGAVVRSGGLERGPQAARALEVFFERASNEAAGSRQAVPSPYWSVAPAPGASDGTEQLSLSGAVLVVVRGRKPRDGHAAAALSPELALALEEQPARPARDLMALLAADGLLHPMLLGVSLVAAAALAIVEGILFRSLFDLGRELPLVHQRLGAMAVLLVFLFALLLLELPISSTVQRLGRHLEMRLRVTFLAKIPRLADRYFQSRPVSDMAERCHSMHMLRLLPDLGVRLVRTVIELMLTTAGIIWIDPHSAPLAVLVAVIAITLPLVLQRTLTERDLRLRTHVGGLSRFYLDALLGLVAIKTHNAEPAIRREQESLLIEWARAGRSLVRAVVTIEGLQSLIGFGLVVWLLLDYLGRTADSSSVLLFLYWTLNLPVLGQEIALVARQYPSLRTVTLRLLEPLGALEQAVPASPPAPSPRSRGAEIAFEGVSVRAAGHTILADVDVEIASGAHVAIVGPSGAGKSSLVGLLLGWHRAASGRLLVDGRALDPEHLQALRRETAWIDPAIQLWNRSVLENVLYGADTEAIDASLVTAIEAADLRKVLESLPDGLQSALGEGGALVSGGEGQRVRFARALLKPSARLVILDEPFRGLDRGKRRDLLNRARRFWQRATLLCVTHDVGETSGFERVLVIEGGRVVEDDSPTVLLEKPDSRYRSLLDAEEAVNGGLWSDDSWRHLWLDDGKLSDHRRSTAS